MPDVFLPERLADAEGELPAEIVKAIDEFEIAVHFGDTREGANPAATQAALTATILARLTAAESARDAARSDEELAHRQMEEARTALSEQLVAALARAERAEAALEPLWQRARAPGADRVPDDATVTVFMKDCREALSALAHPVTAEET